MLDKLSFFQFMFERNIWWIFPCTFLVGVASFSLLIMASHSRFAFIRRLFYIPARKSITNAVQLGGLPLAFTMVLGFAQVFAHPNFESFFSVLDHYSYKYWFLSASIIALYGYFDDRFELRPIVKLMLQVFSICTFALLESRVLFPHWGAFAFVVISFVGLGVINGSNLLDGLDTLTIKLSMVSLGGFFVIAYNYSIASVAVTSLVATCALGSFYLFNKEPARIHLGEIGGSFMGFSLILISCLTYTAMTRMKFGHWNAFATCLMPLLLPMIELSISFLRRIYNRKSPFKGDKYHLHHLLRNYHHFSPSHASSLFAAGYGVSMLVGFSVGHFFGPIYGCLSMSLTLITGYIMVGRKHWKTTDSMDLKPQALFDYLLKKDVSVISSLEVDDFHLEIIGEHEMEDHPESQEDASKEDNKEDIDKAA